MYKLRNVIVNTTDLEISWSKRMTKTKAKVLNNKNKISILLSKTLIKSIDDITDVITELFRTNKLFISDKGYIYSRGK